MGHHNIRFDGDPYSLRGAWSPPTSRANFCEEDYALTYYLAEFINSLTNLAYSMFLSRTMSPRQHSTATSPAASSLISLVYLALRSLYGRRGRSRKVDFMSISLLSLGIGSFLFHASLRSMLEFADEFSMLGLTWSMLQATLTARQSQLKANCISAILATGFMTFSVIYIQFPSIIYQVIAFATGIFLVILRSQYLFHWIQPRFFELKSRDWNQRTWKAIGTCLVGYLLWNIDLGYCAELRSLRQQVGLPWAWLFELHGWWHILTAIGAHQFMEVAREIHEEVEYENMHPRFKSWPRMGQEFE